MDNLITSLCCHNGVFSGDQVSVIDYAQVRARNMVPDESITLQ